MNDDPDQLLSEPQGARATPHPFFTVGIGASAGGLEALAELVR